MSLPRGCSKCLLSLFQLVNTGVPLSSFVSILCSDSAHRGNSAPIVLFDFTRDMNGTMFNFYELPFVPTI